MAQAAKSSTRSSGSTRRRSTKSSSASVSELRADSGTRTTKRRTTKKAPSRSSRSSSNGSAVARRDEASVTVTPDGLPLGVNGLLGAGEVAVHDEFAQSAPAFGTFVGAVGSSVADAQAKLDKTFIETAQALSKEKVKVVSVFEQVIDDDGKLKQGEIHESELPLINFITPTAYKWSRVFLQADMQIAEFSADAGMRIQGHSTSFNIGARASYGLFSGGWNAGGSTSFATSNFSREVSTSASTDSAAGQLHMEATLEPRDDIRPPQPFILQKGPTLQLLVDKIEDISGPPPSNGAPQTVIGRKATIKALLKKQDGSANTGKAIDHMLSESGLAVTSTGDTDSNGVTMLTIERRNPANDGSPGNPVSFVLRAQFGLISDSLGLTL